MPRIAYLGPEGTFTEQAALALVDHATHELDPARTVATALDAVRAGTADAACVPVENSVEGSVPATLDALARDGALVAVAETVLPVWFSVLVRPGTTAEQVRTVASHPHALAQVRDWLAERLPNATTVATTSTAAGAVAVREGEADASISAPIAARRFPDLHELATEVNDVADAATRFLLVRAPGQPTGPTGADRTSIAVVTGDRTGSLSEVLTELASRGINLTRIESRPTKERFGEYRFFLDFSGHVAEARVGDALAALRRRCIEVRFLGSFPRADQIQAVAAHGNADADFAAAERWLAGIRAGGAQ